MSAHPNVAWRSDATRWLVGPPADPNATVRLVCIAHAGGGASFFRPWGALIPPHAELWVAQLPGRESRFRDTAPVDVAAVAAALSQALARLPARPTVLFGHSLGALIAFELAHAMVASGLGTPLLLAPSGRTPPDDRRGPHHLLHLDDEALVDGLAREYGGIAPAILDNPALRELYAPVLRADLHLVSGYRCPEHAPLDCALRIFGGDADPHVPVGALPAWQRFTRGAFGVQAFAGGHFYLSDHAPAIVASLLGPGTAAA